MLLVVERREYYNYEYYHYQGPSLCITTTWLVLETHRRHQLPHDHH